MTRTADVVIIGGGVIGNAVAFALAKEKVKVLVLEGRSLGGSATGAAAGMIAAQEEAGDDAPFLSLSLRSRALFKEWVPEVWAISSLDPQWETSGIWRAAGDGAEAELLAAKAARQSERGLNAYWVPSTEACAALAGVSASHGAFFAPEDGMINPVLWSRALSRAARRLGARMEEYASALSFLTSAGRVTGVATARERVSAGRVVAAAGAWTGALLKDLNVDLGLEPVKGQILAAAGAPGVFKSPVYAGDGYLVPRADGRVLIGATVEKAGFDDKPTPAAREKLLSWAARWCPSLAAADVVGVQVGFRPGSPDGRPVMGPVPGWENLFVAAGHHRNGILLSPVTGKTMAAGLAADRWDPLIAPYSPARFMPVAA